MLLSHVAPGVMGPESGGDRTMECTPAGSPLLQDHWEMQSVGWVPAKDERESWKAGPSTEQKGEQKGQEEGAGEEEGGADRPSLPSRGYFEGANFLAIWGSFASRFTVCLGPHQPVTVEQGHMPLHCSD